MVAKLQGNVDPKKGSGLEYAYIDVRDEYRDGKLTALLKIFVLFSTLFFIFFLFINWYSISRLVFSFAVDHTHLAVWLLDGDSSHSHLLKYAMTEKTYSSTLLMLTVSITTPWAMLDQLREWASLIQDHIDKLPFSAEAIREYQHKCNLNLNF